MTEHEDRGNGIPGSRFYREYCVRCDTPMRVTEENRFGENYCEVCGPHRPPEKADILVERQRAVMFRQSNKDI